MKLTKMEEDLRIHQKLDDEPNDVGGLTAQELKAKFDQAGLALQSYLNETHLPEEETAVAEAVEEAKKYTDEKVADLGPGDMSAAVYDTQQRRVDVFEYAEAKAREAREDTSKQGYICGGNCNLQAVNSHIPVPRPSDLIDPKGIWPEGGKTLVAPAGAKAVMVWFRISWMRQATALCHVRLKVNDEVRLDRLGPTDNSGLQNEDTLLMMATVKGGDTVSMEVQGVKGYTSNTNASITMKDIFVEFIL